MHHWLRVMDATVRPTCICVSVPRQRSHGTDVVSFCLNLSLPSVTTHLKFSNRAISIVASRLPWERTAT